MMDVFRDDWRWTVGQNLPATLLLSSTSEDVFPSRASRRACDNIIIGRCLVLINDDLQVECRSSFPLNDLFKAPEREKFDARQINGEAERRYGRQNS